MKTLIKKVFTNADIYMVKSETNSYGYAHTTSFNIITGLMGNYLI